MNATWILIILSFNLKTMIYFEFKTEASCEDKRTEISQLAPGYFDKSYENTVCVLDLDEDGI